GDDLLQRQRLPVLAGADDEVGADDAPGGQAGGVGRGPHRRREQVAGQLRRVRAVDGGAGTRRRGVRLGEQRALLEESVDGPGDTEGPQDLVAAGADVDPREGDGQVDDPGRPGAWPSTPSGPTSESKTVKGRPSTSPARTPSGVIVACRQPITSFHRAGSPGARSW